MGHGGCRRPTVLKEGLCHLGVVLMKRREPSVYQCVGIDRLVCNYANTGINANLLGLRPTSCHNLDTLQALQGRSLLCDVFEV